MNNITQESDISTEGLCVIKFWASWCGPCKRMEPTILTLEEEFASIKFLSLNVDDFPNIANKYSVKTIPTLLILENGKEKNRISGLHLITPLRKIFRELTK